MTEPGKKLLQFSVIFIAGALVIFFFMNNKSSSSSAEKDPAMVNGDGQTKELLNQLDVLKANLKQEPGNSTYITHIANIYYDLNQPDSAIKFYEQALAINPEDPTLLTDCAVMYFQTGNSDKALEYLDLAIGKQPDLAQAWFNKGLILMAAKNEPQKALETWKEYIKLAPETEQAKFIREQIQSIENGE
jgi:tetratricopeptide (TPR) repeat protein